MDSYMQSLTDRIGSAWQAQKDLLDKIAEEKRDITPEEKLQVERMDAETDTLIAERKRYADRIEVVNAANRFRSDMEARIEPARAERREPTDREMLLEIIKGERRSMESHFTPERDIRALQSEGGSAVPTSFADIFTIYQRTVDPTTLVATVIDTSSAAPLVIPRSTADAAGGGTVTAENGGITVSDSTISQIDRKSVV